MNLEQYIGCLIKYHGKVAVITGARSNYDGDCFFLQYQGTDTVFPVRMFDKEVLNALPDPKYGILKRIRTDVVFLWNETEYILGSQPYEPCLYIKRNGEIIRTIHNAFCVDELPERFAQGETLMGIDGREYDLASFSRVLIASITSTRPEMDFTFAAVLSRTETEPYPDDPAGSAPKNLTEKTPQPPRVMKFCPKCGTKNTENNYCTECGTRLLRD